jgi:hypothetical protein
MALDLTANPIYVDATFSGKFSAQTGVTIPPGGLVVDHIRWFAPTTGGHTFILADGNAKTILTDICKVAHQSVDYPMYGLKLDDFQVGTLASGALYIYFR